MKSVELTRRVSPTLFVIPGLMPGIHVFNRFKTGMAAISAAMTGVVVMTAKTKCLPLIQTADNFRSRCLQTMQLRRVRHWRVTYPRVILRCCGAIRRHSRASRAAFLGPAGATIEFLAHLPMRPAKDDASDPKVSSTFGSDARALSSFSPMGMARGRWRGGSARMDCHPPQPLQP